MWAKDSHGQMAVFLCLGVVVALCSTIWVVWMNA